MKSLCSLGPNRERSIPSHIKYSLQVIKVPRLENKYKPVDPSFWILIDRDLSSNGLLMDNGSING